MKKWRTGFINLTALLAIAFFLNACGHSADSQDALKSFRGFQTDLVQVHKPRRVIKAEKNAEIAQTELLEPKVERLFLEQRPFLEECDLRYELPIKKILSEIDRHLQSIHNVNKKNEGKLLSDSNRTNEVATKMGPLVLVQDKNQAAPKRGWYNYQSRGWPALLKKYIISENNDDQFWYDLNDEVRNVLSSDFFRIENHINLELNYDAKPFLERAKIALTACVKNKKCVKPKMKIDLYQWLAANKIYQTHFRQVRNEKGFNDKRQAIVEFSKRIDDDYDDFEFKPESTVKKVDATHVSVPFDASILGEAGALDFKNYIESFWKSDLIQVQVQLKKVTAAPGLWFQLALPREVGERSRLDRSGKVMELFSLSHKQTVVHEFGHLLGFQDHYYEVWNADDCHYHDYGREDDVMSLHYLGGGVTDEEWQELEQHYLK